GAPAGIGPAARAGITAYSARPPIEYIHTGEPLASNSRVVPSYNVPFRRLCVKNGSHSSSRPDVHIAQPPHGMMKAPTTLWPSLMWFTPAPTAATLPETS